VDSWFCICGFNYLHIGNTQKNIVPEQACNLEMIYSTWEDVLGYVEVLQCFIRAISECLQILVYEGNSGISFLCILRDNCRYIFSAYFRET
jgi:hypothetical protein